MVADVPWWNLRSPARNHGMAQCETCSLVLPLKSAARGPVIRRSVLHRARNRPWWIASNRTLRVLLVCVVLDAGVVPLGPPPAVLISAATVAAVQVPGVAEAQTSGGYSRPGGGSSSRGYVAPARRPSVGGAFGSGSAWGGDRSISRQTSSEALQNYRASQQSSSPAFQTPSRRPSSDPIGAGWGIPPTQRRPDATGLPRTYSAPAYGASGAGSGFWSTAMLWTLLNSLSSPGNAAFFRDNQGDPRYAQWRAEAERAAQRDPEVAQKLADLDRALAQAPNARQTAAAANISDNEGSAGLVLAGILLGGTALVLFWLRRHATGRSGGAAGASPGHTGSTTSRFRVGMTLPMDPAPFLLAAGLTKVTPPPGGGSLISVEALGLVRDGAASLYRLYLPARASFFQLHLGPDGAPDECRYFSTLDQVAPASEQEWGFWLDPSDGMIGWPEFQTKDGKVYSRAWAPGNHRVSPRQQDETLQDVGGTTRRRIQAMLYGAPTSAAPPAPAAEYVLVSAIEQAGQAWVEICAGIDINAASLSLPAVPLSS
jgi:hypothetical protein